MTDSKARIDPVKESIELYLTERIKYLDSRALMDPVKDIVELFLTRRKNIP